MNRFLTFCTCLTLAALFNCSRQAKEVKNPGDSLDVASFPEMEMDSSSSEISRPMADLEGADTLYNILARLKLLEGELVGVTVMTESFVAINSGPGKKELVAALIETGIGEYTGLREASHETTHAVLAVFEWQNDGYSLVAQANVGDGGGYGIKLFTTTAETVSLMPGGEAVMIHSKSSESGAGDYGFRKDDVAIYILLNNSITSVFETTLEDYQFTSDEQTATAERTVTSEINVLETVTKGLYDIRQFTTTVLSRTDDEEESEKEPKADEASTSQPDPGQLFTWDGSHYQPHGN
jgi:hypothetical protein